MARQELTIRENQQAVAAVMAQIHNLCEQLHLKYYLTFGTLIGAIRHQGFIPWDDDLDIMMPRKDYELLLDYFHTNEEALAPLKLFTNRNNPAYPYMIARICDCRYVIETDNEKDCGMGAFVDIYPMDGVGNTLDECAAKMRKSSPYASLCFLSTRLRCEKGNTKSKLRLLIKLPAFLVAKLVGKRYFMRKLESFAQQCDPNSQYIACVVWEPEGLKGVFPKTWFVDTVDVPFEGYTFKAPKEYDKILRQIYGDYMQLPPEEDRIAHHFYHIYKI